MSDDLIRWSIAANSMSAKTISCPEISLMVRSMAHGVVYLMKAVLGAALAAAAAVFLPYLPVLIARLKHKPVETGRVVFGEGQAG